MFPPVLKYIAITIIEEIMQARLRDSAVLFVGEILIIVVLNNKKSIKILVICSMNSVILMAKKRF